MALQSSSGALPKGAVPLTAEQALDYQWDQILNWPEKKDVWPYRYGFSAQAFLSAMSAMYVNKKFRNFLKLRHQGYGASLLPMVIVPPMLSVILHCQHVSVDIILSRKSCSLCLQQRAAMIQVACGTVYPLTLAPLANFMFAHQYATTRLPYWKDIRGHVEIWLKVVKPMGRSLLLFSCAHALLAGFVTYGEYESLYTIRTKLSENRKALNEELSE